MSNKESIKRRNLSGIYIFHKFENEEKSMPTSFEDCPVERQREWIAKLEDSSLRELALELAYVLKKVGEECDIIKD
jgi:hypothetical protein